MNNRFVTMVRLHHDGVASLAARFSIEEVRIRIVPAMRTIRHELLQSQGRPQGTIAFPQIGKNVYLYLSGRWSVVFLMTRSQRRRWIFWKEVTIDVQIMDVFEDLN